MATKVGKTKTVQKTIAGKGFEPDQVGKLALELLEADEELKTKFKELKSSKAALEQKLVEALHKAGRDSITIDGKKFRIARREEHEFIKIGNPRLNESES